MKIQQDLTILETALGMLDYEVTLVRREGWGEESLGGWEESLGGVGGVVGRGGRSHWEGWEEESLGGVGGGVIRRGGRSHWEGLEEESLGGVGGVIGRGGRRSHWEGWEESLGGVGGVIGSQLHLVAIICNTFLEWESMCIYWST